MSLWQLYNEHQQQKSTASDSDLRRALSGNLCRCTGYRPILEAGRKMFDLPVVPFDYPDLENRLQTLRRDQSASYQYQSKLFHSPRSLKELIQLKASLPTATVLAGCTDIGLWVNKQLKDLGHILYLGQIDELKTISTNAESISIGAGVSLSAAFDVLLVHYPAAAELCDRFASVPIRNAGTLGGNIANGSPIGDSMPWLIAVGTQVTCQNSERQRTLLLEDYYIDYMQTALQDDELLISISVPLPRPSQQFRTYKISKRYDSDISAICVAISITLQDNIICEAVVAFGGMAATTQRASSCEQALVGNQWNQSTVSAAQTALLDDFQPLSDLRASSQNRQTLAQNLIYRFFLETRSENPVASTLLSVHSVNS